MKTCSGLELTCFRSFIIFNPQRTKILTRQCELCVYLLFCIVHSYIQRTQVHLRRSKPDTSPRDGNKEMTLYIIVDDWHSHSPKEQTDSFTFHAITIIQYKFIKKLSRSLILYWQLRISYGSITCGRFTTRLIMDPTYGIMLFIMPIPCDRFTS